MRAPLQTAAALLSLALWSAPGVAEAQRGWHEGFDSTTTSWRSVGGDGQSRVAAHARVSTDMHSGSACEWLRIEADAASHLCLAHDIGNPCVIEELAISVWVKSDRPGMRLTARVVLPRTTDPSTGRPMTVSLVGGVYSDVGRWQELRIETIPRSLARQIHILRMQFGPNVDEREAYLDSLLLNVYGGPGPTNLWIDDLDIAGHVPAGGAADSNVGNGGGTVSLTPVRLPPVEDSAPSAVPRHTVKLVGSVLLVDGRPMFPRIIQHRGEPLEMLKKCGFNAVWLSQLPPPEVLREANRLDLWLVCPPPKPVGTGPLVDFGPQFDCVLAWNLGENLGEAELEATQHWAEQVHAADRRGSRPLICNARADLRGYSRPANLLLIDRRPLGTSMELTDYAALVRRQPLLASLGTPVWTTVQTQPNEPLCRQAIAFDPSAAPPRTVAPEQMRLLAYTAVAAGSRGIVFTSDSPLDASDPETRERAEALELLNLELDLMEPWAAAGSFMATADASRAEVAGAVLRTEHSRLLLPLWSARGAQCVPPQSAASKLALVAPGVPEASAAYELTPNGVLSLPHQRVAGGVRVTLPEFGLTTQVLLAQQPLIVTAVNRRAASMGRRSAELQRELAVHKLGAVEATAARLASRVPVRSAAAWFETARKSLALCDAQLTQGSWAEAALNAQRAGRALRLIERAYWDASVKGLISPVASPAAMSFGTLPAHWRLIDRLSTGRFGPNRLAAGDFEDIGAMMQAGWRYVAHPAPTVQTAVDLMPQAAHGGRIGVRLAVTAVDPKNPPAAIETPPLLFISPSVQVSAGELVCIHGWVQVPNAVTGSSDGLLVVDSISGEPLAERIGKTREWRQFALYRIATQSGPVGVTFALSGMGEVLLDDVEIQVIAD